VPFSIITVFIFLLDLSGGAPCLYFCASRDFVRGHSADPTWPCKLSLALLDSKLLNLVNDDDSGQSTYDDSSHYKEPRQVFFQP
jgi:hypothetical protein